MTCVHQDMLFPNCKRTSVIPGSGNILELVIHIIRAVQDKNVTIIYVFVYYGHITLLNNRPNQAIPYHNTAPMGSHDGRIICSTVDFLRLDFNVLPKMISNHDHSVFFLLFLHVFLRDDCSPIFTGQV